MPLWGHALLCVAVPAGWGLLMVVVFSAVDRRSGDPPPSAGDDELAPPIDYNI